MVTKEQAVQAGDSRNRKLHYGECKRTVRPRGGVKETITSLRVNGRCRTWKRRPEHFELPLKHGLRTYIILNERNAGNFHWAEECPLDKPVVGEAKK